MYQDESQMNTALGQCSLLWGEYAATNTVTMTTNATAIKSLQTRTATLLLRTLPFQHHLSTSLLYYYNYYYNLIKKRKTYREVEWKVTKELHQKSSKIYKWVHFGGAREEEMEKTLNKSLVSRLRKEGGKKDQREGQKRTGRESTRSGLTASYRTNRRGGNMKGLYSDRT